MFKLIQNIQVKESWLPALMLVFLVFSWGLYPMMGCVWFFPEIRYVVLMLFVLLVTLYFAHRGERNSLSWPILIRWVIGLYLIYFVSLGVASVASGDSFSMMQYAKYTLKILFFILLLNMMTETLIKKSLQLYSHIVLILVVLSLFVMFAVAFFYVQPLLNFETVAAGGGTTVVPFYGLVFYGQAPLATSEFPWARLQGLSGEPGSFALAIIPAYFYFLIVEKSVWKLAVVVLGLVLTVSFGTALFFVMVIASMILFRLHAWRKLFVHILSVAMIIFITILPTHEKVYEQANHWHGWSNWVEYLEAKTEVKTEGWGTSSVLKSKIGGGDSSLGGRIKPCKDALIFVSKNPWGTGMALGMPTLKEAVAMGYVWLY